MKNWIPACGAGLAVLSAAACGTTTTRTVDVTTTVAGPVLTMTAPGPTVTVTAQPQALTSKTFSGSGEWNSPSFSLACANGSAAVTVKYSYSGNESGGTGDDFMADLEETGSGDDQSTANIFESVSGGTTTTVYPQPQNSGDYYLSVQASGNWTFNLSETC